MRRKLFIAIAVAAPLAFPAAAAGGTGGAAPEVTAPGAAAHPPPAAPKVRRFAITPGAMRSGGVARIVLRIDGSTSSVRTRVEILPAGARRAAARIDLGTEPTGQVVSHRWRQAKPLAAGRYVARLHAVDGNGQRLKRSAGASGKASLRVVARPSKPAPTPPTPTPTPSPSPSPTPAPPAPAPTPTGSGRFPVQGPYSFGGSDARFGAGRSGHSHQGQDVMAAEGTPIVSPRAGVVHWRAFQGSGAGHYLVVRGDDGRDLVFMHLREGSLLVAKGDPVAAGQRIAEVGNSGRSDGAHLHFEIWPGGWWEKGSAPIDPLPQLQAWAAG